MSDSSSPLPRTWDLAAYFPEFGGPAYREFVATLRADLAQALTAATSLPPLGEAAAEADDAAWAGVFSTWENLAARLAHLTSYLGCLNAGDAAHEGYQAEEAALALVDAQLAKLKSQLLRGLRPAGEPVFAALLARPALSGAEHTVRRLRDEAVFQMAPAEEALAADLGVDGFKGWGRLYDTLSGKMTFPMAWPDGRHETVPMAQRRALMAHPERAVRAAAFAGGNTVWAAHEDTCAAALNALAGTRHTLYTRRGRGHFLDVPLHDAALSRATLDAMFAAIGRGSEVPRRILRLGAQLQGTSALAWFDLEAPRPLGTAPTVDWTQAVAQVRTAFTGAYPRLGDYFDRMIERRWIESEKRASKRAGAFQTGSPLTREERIYQTFADTMHDVVTLAHEVGHAWHTHLLGDLRPCARDYPMTLAETASTFGEQVLVHGLLAQAGDDADQRAFLLDQLTNQAPAYLLNIPVRFRFEQQFYAERRAGVVAPSRLRELMVAAQREVYGDTLETGAEDPWFWASKLHFFITDVSFYNFPYTFGYLLSQALAREFRRAGPEFLPRYEAFLRATGSATCEEAVRQTLGWDIRDEGFWAEAITGVGEPLAEFERLVAARAALRS